MSGYYLIEINCDLKPDTPEEILDYIKSYSGREVRPLRNFPGWSISKFEKVKKWENMVRYVFSSRYELHEDVLDNDDYSFWEILAKYSETDGFVGFLYYSLSFNPDLIYFEDGKVRLWDISEFDPQQWEFRARDKDELTANYERAKQKLLEGYNQKLEKILERPEEE